MLNQNQVASASNASHAIGSMPNHASGRQGEALVSQLGGTYAAQTLAGSMFEATTTAESELKVDSSLVPTFVFWNPANSGKIMVPVRYTAGWTGTTETPGNIEFAWLAAAGDTLGDTAPMTVFTAGTLRNCMLGGGNAAAVRFATTCTITTPAGNVFMSTGMSHLTTTGASTATQAWTNRFDFNGILAVPPGNVIYTVSSTATATLYNQTLVWYEIPTIQ